MRFAGRNVLITGIGNNELGRLIAMRFASEGANLILHFYQEADAAAGIVEEIEQNGYHTIALSGNLQNRRGSREFIKKAAKRLGGLDIVVSVCAVDEYYATSEDENMRADLSFVESAISEAFVHINNIAKYMCANNLPGRIIVIETLAQSCLLSYGKNYHLVRAWAMKHVQDIAFEFSPFGISVNLVQSYSIANGLNDESVNAEYGQHAVLMNRFDYPNDVVEAAVFFAGSASSSITGNAISCNAESIMSIK